MKKTSQLTLLVEELLVMASKAVNDKICELNDDGKHMLVAVKVKAYQTRKQAYEIVRKHSVETALIAVPAGLATW